MKRGAINKLPGRMSVAELQKLSKWRVAADHKRSKYGNRTFTCPKTGIVFDSEAEYERWCQLQLLQTLGQIKGLDRQVDIPLEVNGVHVCYYRADFVYYDNTTQTSIVEDCKGYRTDTYIIKAKLMQAVHGIKIYESKPQKLKKDRRRKLNKVH
jgi:Protein of unknown function (DUF1064).